MLVFGYGSLVNINSIKKTCGPDVEFIDIALLHGYERYFGIRTKRLDWLGRGISAVSIREAGCSTVNGVVYNVTPEGFDRLCKREKNYTPINIKLQSLSNPVTNIYATTFIAIDNVPRQRYLFLSKTQDEYLKTCETGFDNLGEYQLSQFLSSTDGLPKTNLYTVIFIILYILGVTKVLGLI